MHVQLIYTHENVLYTYVMYEPLNQYAPMNAIWIYTIYPVSLKEMLESPQIFLYGDPNVWELKWHVGPRLLFVE